MSEETDYQKNRETMLTGAKDYYNNNKETLRDKARNKYQKLSEEEKNIKTKYERNRYLNMFEEKTQKLKEYQKNIMRPRSLNLVINKIAF